MSSIESKHLCSPSPREIMILVLLLALNILILMHLDLFVLSYIDSSVG